MVDPRQERGDHNWITKLEYIPCPQCGLIIEDRQLFQKVCGQEFKDITCPRCSKTFTVHR